MRNALLFLSLLAVGLFAFFVLLPILSVLALIVLGLVVIAPFLLKLPWFRNRIFVHRSGNFTSVRYGRGFAAPQEPYQEDAPRHHLNHGDVIDVQGRELPAEDDEAEKRD